MAEEAEQAATSISAISARRANLFEELEALFRDYGETGTGRTATTSMTRAKPQPTASQPGTFTDWGTLPEDPTCCSTRGCMAPSSPTRSMSRSYADLKIGVVPVINLEWIQKLHRDRARAAIPTEAVTDTILRRMPDYVNYICPQFAETDINFQRVPTVDTSNPFIAR